MIALDIKDYCHNCEHFEAEVEKVSKFDNMNQINWHTTIRCTNRSQCALLYSHIKKEQFEKKGFTYYSNKCGLKLIDYDNMLYPQYEYKFDKVISDETWKDIQEQARKNLEGLEELDKEHRLVHPDVIAHWQSIVEGQVPFGYRVEE